MPAVCHVGIYSKMSGLLKTLRFPNCGLDAKATCTNSLPFEGHQASRGHFLIWYSFLYTVGGERSGPLISFNTQLEAGQGSWGCFFPSQHDSTHLALKDWKVWQKKKDNIKQPDSMYFNHQFQAKKSEFVNWTPFILPLLLMNDNENVLRY